MRLDAILLVVDRLGDMDVDAGTAATAMRDGAVEQGVADGEGRVKPHQALPLAEIVAPSPSSPASRLALPSRSESSTQRRCERPIFIERAGDDVEAPLHGVGRRVVVDDEGRPALAAAMPPARAQARTMSLSSCRSRFHQTSLSMSGNSSARARARASPGQRGVKVVVGDDEGLGDEAAPEQSRALAPRGMRGTNESCPRARRDLQMAAAHAQRAPVDERRVPKIEHQSFIGSVRRRLPSKAQKALATAPRWGTRPISPTPLAP